MKIACGTVLLAATAAAFPSVAGLFKREDTAITSGTFTSDGYVVVVSSYIQTDLQTITTTITINPAEATPAAPSCKYSLGETLCGSVCCTANQFCESPADSLCAATNPPCSNPCGWQGQLCCAAGDFCVTDANGQAQCQSASSNSTSPGCGPSTTVYTVTQSYESTILETITLVLSRIERGVEVVTRTATFATTAICAPALGQTQCGNVCCLAGQFCQASGTRLPVACPPFRPTSDTRSGAIVTMTNTAQPPVRPTVSGSDASGSVGGSVTTTMPFQTPISTG